MAGGFMSGFGPAFGKTFSAGVERAMDSYDDKVKTQMAYALEQKSAFEKAKSADEALVKKAEALAANVPGAPNEAWKVAYGQLKAGRNEEKILEEMRKGSWTAVETPETVDTPEASIEAPVEAQMQEVLGQPTSQPKAPEEAPAQPEEQEDKGIMDTLQGFRDKNKARVESNVNESVRSRLGVEQGQYDEWLTGYSSSVSEAMRGFKFTPPVAGTDEKPPTDPKKYRFWMLTNSQEFKAADPATQDQMVTSFEAGYEEDDSAISFGNSMTGGLMNYWMETPEGQEAVASGNISSILDKATEFTEGLSSNKVTDKPENISDMTSYLYNQWADTEAGTAAIENNDVEAIGAAWVSASNQAEALKGQVKVTTGFDPAEVKDVNQIPGLRAKYADSPEILSQLTAIETGLKENAASAQAAQPGTNKPVTILMSTPEGKQTTVTGIMNSKTGLSIGGKPVPAEEVPAMLVLSADQPIDIEKINANEWTKTKNGLHASADLAETSLRYMATFEKNPLARTWTMRTAASIEDFFSAEIPAIGSVLQNATFTIKDKDNNDVTMVDATKLQSMVMNAPELSDMAIETRRLLAQELALPFILAKADGNSGTALSDKDYANYYNSIFNSKNIEVIRDNIERKVYERMNSAVKKAEGMGELPAAKYIVGAQWWNDPLAYALDSRDPAVQNFVQASYTRTKDVYAGSSYGRAAAEEEQESTTTTAPVEVPSGLSTSLRQRLDATKGGSN